MSKKDIDFNKSIMVRIYDTGLAKRLGQAFAEGKFESKSGFLTELIEDGLNNHATKTARQAELSSQSLSFDKRLATLEQQLAEYQSTVYSQLKHNYKDLEAVLKALGAEYSILTALYQGEYIPRQELESGLYDYLPERFWEQ